MNNNINVAGQVAMLRAMESNLEPLLIGPRHKLGFYDTFKVKGICSSGVGSSDGNSFRGSSLASVTFKAEAVDGTNFALLSCVPSTPSLLEHHNVSELPNSLIIARGTLYPVPCAGWPHDMLQPTLLAVCGGPC